MRDNKNDKGDFGCAVLEAIAFTLLMAVMTVIWIMLPA